LAQGGLEKSRNAGKKTGAAGDKAGADPVRATEPPRHRRRDRIALEVRDERVNPARSAVEASAGRSEDLRDGNGNLRETDITVDLKGQNALSQARSQGQVSAERENPPVRSYQDMLTRELHENLNGYIVRHAQVVLREGGEGLIRLSLRPESLGNVKIRLELTENKIAGHIIVETDEALRAFEQEIRSLEQAFRDSGFAGADLQMAVASNGSGNNAGQRGNEGEASPFVTGRLAASSYEAGSAETGGISDGDIRWYGPGTPRVNMMV
jgi:hypothetical protein